MPNNQPITELQLSMDGYNHLIAALQIYIKSPKVNEGSFDEVKDLYNHLQRQYALRRSSAAQPTRIPSKTESTLPNGELI